MHAPTGTVTFLFTDIEGSTKLWEQHPEPMRLALARHDALMRKAIADHSGMVFKTIGDAFCAAFPTASDALDAALTVQIALIQELGDTVTPLRVRSALHTGTVEYRDEDYFGQPLNRVARLLGAGYGGQVLLSDVTQELIRDVLPPSVSLKCLGEHRLRDLDRPEPVYQALHSDLPAEFPPLKSLENFPNNLPQQVTSFIGREKEMETVRSLLAKTHLLTLTGAGGSGKTRLSLQVAAELLERYPEGIWLIEFAATTDPALVPQTVASVLGLREQAGKPPLQTLADYLKPRHVLLLLDNCEHLIDACACLADTLLKNCAQAQILASSREALGIAGEQTYRIPSLTLPDADRPPTLESVGQCEAVQLFTDRALSVQPQFTLTDASAPAIAQLCTHLDGIPLAIELAAARTRSLSVEEINARIDDRFRLLTTGSRTALPRQRTLRALIDWSYDLLEPSEKAILARLAVFAGGWTLEAAEFICTGETVESWEVLDLLTSLADKSLLLAEHEGEHTRYRLLESVRQYAQDRLTESGELQPLRARHQQYFLTLARQAEPQLLQSEQAHWLNRLEQEHDNLRAALAAGDKAISLQIAGALWRFWDVRGYLTQGLEWLASGLAANPAPTPARAKALIGAGALARSQGNYTAAQTLHQQCLDLSRELGDQEGIAHSLNNLARIAFNQGDLPAAHTLYSQSLQIQRQLANPRGIATSLQGLGNIAQNQRDYPQARALYEESLAIQRELGNKRGIATSLQTLGNVAQNQGDPTARSLYEESLAIQRELGDKRGIAWSLHGLGNLALAQRDYSTARSLTTECLTLERQLGNKRGIVASLEAFAALSSQQAQSTPITLQGEPSSQTTLQEKQSAPIRNRLTYAPILWGAAQALRERLGVPLHPTEQARYNALVAAHRQALGPDLFDAAWSQGRALTPEQATQLALSTPE